MSNRLKKIRDQIELQGCPVQLSLKAAKLINKVDNKSLTGALAVYIVTNAWADIAERENFY